MLQMSLRLKTVHYIIKYFRIHFKCLGIITVVMVNSLFYFLNILLVSISYTKININVSGDYRRPFCENKKVLQM